MVDTVKSMQEIEAISEARPVPVGAADAFTQALQTATAAQEYTGAVPLIDKEKLQGVPFLVMGYKTHSGIGEGDYVFVRCMLPNAAQVGFTDGGAAIAPVLDEHARTVGFVGQQTEEPEDESVFMSPLYCPRGLRRSDYTNEQGIDATTYWIA